MGDEVLTPEFSVESQQPPSEKKIADSRTPKGKMVRDISSLRCSGEAVCSTRGQQRFRKLLLTRSLRTKNVNRTIPIKKPNGETHAGVLLVVVICPDNTC